MAEATQRGALFRGCLFCRSGKEAEVARRFDQSFPGGRAIAPTRTRYRRKPGIAIEETVILMPGYVFFEIDDDPQLPAAGEETRVSKTDVDLRAFVRTENVLRLLRYPDGTWRLHGADDRFASLLFDTGGNIGISRAYFDEGNRIRILEGFLKDYEGSVVRVNRKTKTAEISVDIQGKKVSMWLGYELIADA